MLPLSAWLSLNEDRIIMHHSFEVVCFVFLSGSKHHLRSPEKGLNAFAKKKKVCTFQGGIGGPWGGKNGVCTFLGP